MENELPKNWAITNLKGILNDIIGGDWGISPDDENNDYVICKVLRGTDFKNWEIEKTRHSAIRKIKKSSLNKRGLKLGDIIIEVSGGGPDQPVGRAIIIDKKTLDFEKKPLVCSNFFRKIRLNDNINPFYINYLIKNHYLKGFFNDIQTHTTNLRNLRVEDYLKYPLAIPPLQEQTRIVAKLDELFEKIEINKQRISKIPRILKRFRQSILAAAVSGKLTEDWRAENSEFNPTIVGNSFEINETFKNLTELPSNWQWVALGNYVNCNRGRFSIRPRNDPKYFGGNIPFIQIGDLPKNGGYVNYHTQTLNADGLKVSKMFPKNTVAVAIVGATIGNSGILSYDMCFTDSIVGINKGELFLNLYIDYYLRSEKENLRQLSYAGGGQPNIKLELLNSYPFPLPPLEEQAEIVRRVEQLFAYADKIEVRYEKAKRLLDKLPQSILSKAFRGELVPQNSNDEPASELLEKIKSEKTKMQGGKRN